MESLSELIDPFIFLDADTPFISIVLLKMTVSNKVGRLRILFKNVRFFYLIPGASLKTLFSASYVDDNGVKPRLSL